MLPPIDEIISNFELLDDWDERYRYLIELGRLMEKLPDDACIWWVTATHISCAVSWPC